MAKDHKNTKSSKQSSSGRIRSRKNLTSKQETPLEKDGARRRPQNRVDGQSDRKTNQIRRASPEERRTRPRGEPKPGRKFKPLVYAENGMRIEDLPHEVGYAKFPEDTKFRKGKSGNPKGRPREAKNIDTLYRKALDQKIVSRIGGEEKKISVREGIVQRTIQKALEGDPRFVKLIMEKDSSLELRASLEENQSEQEEDLDNTDKEILDLFIKQIEEGNRADNRDEDDQDDSDAGADSEDHDDDS